MKKHLTELVFILDKSGSMSGLETDTIGGFNAMIKQQKEGEGEVNVTTVLFSDQVKQLYSRRAIADVQPMTERDYRVGGCTALLDAIGESIQYMKNVQEYVAERERADKVLFIITTDGYENSSREYSYGKIKQMIGEMRGKEWDFLFLGANIDAIATAGQFGIKPEFATNYVADEQGTQLNYRAMNAAVTCARESRPMEGWKDEVELDYLKRKLKKNQ